MNLTLLRPIPWWKKDNKKTKNDQLKVRLICQINNMPKVEAFFTQMRQEKEMEGSSKVVLKEGPVYTMGM